MKTTSLADRVRKIDLLLLDVDGVLTDGRIVYSESAGEIKAFHVRDGSGLKVWHLLGKKTSIISGRVSSVVERRATELGIAPVLMGHGTKLPALRQLIAETGIPSERIAAMGDDLADVPILRNCGVGIAVADACAELREVADYVTTTPGGNGAVREAVEWILGEMGLWRGFVDSLTGERL